MSVTAAQIKELRETSGAGMMDCKKALVESNGNIEEAMDWLRTKGLATAAKKSGRVASEGLVAVVTADDKASAAMIEFNSETDFVARNEQFQQLSSAIAGYALKKDGDMDAVLAHTCDVAGKSVSEVITDTIATIGENMNLRRTTSLAQANGVVASYIHGAVAPGLGKIGVLVSLESAGDKAKLEALGKQIAMHVAAAKPEALTRDDVDSSTLDRERSVLKEQAMASGKPESIAEKMVEGRINKFYSEIVLLEQVFVVDGKISVTEAIKNAEAEVGAPIKLAAFERFTLGEGIEKEEEDFAAEVAKTAGAA